jgi:glutamine synthetase
VNLYLAAATVLAGVLRGIEQQLDPGPPVQGNGYSLQSISPALPSTWGESIQRAADSTFLKDAFGPEFHKVFLAIKRQEYQRWCAEVTPTDLLWYLRDT